MKLHYSQTFPQPGTPKTPFQYLMKLHYSQTAMQSFGVPSGFQYLMKLHYSQTMCPRSIWVAMVSVPYEITLLSNSHFFASRKTGVSVPYEITLLSNLLLTIFLRYWFQYLMKLHYSQTKL